VLAAALLLCGCASPPPPAPAPVATPQPAPVAPPPAPPPPDACGAGLHQNLIGHPRSEIPVPIKPAMQRVACDSCPITMDFNPNRLNFFFDAASGRITKVNCG
jgi:hypothetical protein